MEIIKAKSQDEFDRLMEYLEKKGYRWMDDSLPTNRDCISYWHIGFKVKLENQLITGSSREETITVDEYIGSNFEVGDKVRYLGNCTGIIGCIHGKMAYMSECISDSGIEYKYPDGGNCEEHKCFMGNYFDRMELVKESNQVTTKPIATDEIYAPYQSIDLSYNEESNKPNTKKMSIVQFAKNLTLSSDEKVLRKQGLRDERGEWTDEANVIVAELNADDKRKDLVEIAKAKEADEKKK